MTNQNELDNFNLCLLVDNTGSMGAACTAARTSIEEVFALSKLLLGRPCVSIASIGDYDNATPKKECGGYALLNAHASENELQSFLNTHIRPVGGGGAPEAYRTGLNHILRLEPKPRILISFLDDVPHRYNDAGLDSEGVKEEAYLKAHKMISKWETLTSAVKTAGIRCVTILTKTSEKLIECWSGLGDCVIITTNTPEQITKTMLNVIYELIGQQNQSTEKHNLKTEVNIDLAQQTKFADPVVVMDTFDRFLDVAHPERAMSLTTNPIIGKYWRLICGKYRYMNDRVHEKRCQDIMDKLSKCKERLPKVQQDSLKKWIDESHDETCEVRDQTTNILKQLTDRKDLQSLQYLVLPEELRGSISLDDVLELGRGGNFSEVAKLIASLEISTEQHDISSNDDVAPDFVPFVVDSNIQGYAFKVFSLIGNLLKPGLIFSKSASLMAAILALHNKHLSDLAMYFLQNNLGKWINWDLDPEQKQLFPVFWSINFMRLLKLAPDSVLTEKELEFRDRYLMIAKIIRNHDATVPIKIPIITDDRLRWDSTWKRLCKTEDGGCGIYRCFTIFPGDSNVCGHCLAFRDEKSLQDAKNRGYDSNPLKHPEKDDNRTNWAQCSSCRGCYGVTTVEHLNVRPKCHNCRQSDDPEFVVCTVCKHRYLSPGGSAKMAMQNALDIYRKLAKTLQDQDDITKLNNKIRLLTNALAGDDFICPCCIEHPSDMTTVIDVKISQLIAENSQLIELIPIGIYKTLMDTQKQLWKRVLDCKVITPTKTTTDIKSLRYRGFDIHDPTSVAANVIKTLVDHSGIDTCQMCVSDVPIRDILLACGNCQNRICRQCVNNWYSQVTVGETVSHCHATCPFCKTVPKFDLVRKLTLGYVRNVRSTKANRGVICPWDHHTIYALCRECLNIKPALQQECARALYAAPEIRNYVCDDCNIAINNRRAQRAEFNLNLAQDAVPTKKCPNCQADTEKSGGCNHITCHCKAHWCWVCGAGAFESGELFDEHTIYDHMADCGGIFPDDIRE